MEENKTPLSNADEIEIDLREIFYLLMSKLWIITLATVVVAVISFAVSKFYLTPIYQSQTKIYILNKTEDSNITYAELQAGSQLTKDYKELITSRPVIEEVIAKFQSLLTYDAMVAKIGVTIPTDTRIVTILVDDENPIVAMNLANAIREAASKHIKEVMNIESVNIVEAANLPEEPYKPSAKRNTLLGGFGAAFLAMAIIVIRHMLDDTIKTPEDVEKRLGLYNLAIIPVIEEETLLRHKKEKKDKSLAKIKLKDKSIKIEQKNRQKSREGARG